MDQRSLFDVSVERAVEALLDSMGEDSLRAGLKDTPERVARAWKHWTSGYNIDPAHLLTTFEDGAENYDEMVAVVNIPFYSHCEHHLAPFFGTATIAYIPDGRVVGLSKLNRILNVYSRRLQVQERLTQQITSCLMECLKPLGAACKIQARHLCMESRGVCQQGHHTVTTSLLGRFREDPAVRAEFLAL